MKKIITILVLSVVLVPRVFAQSSQLIGSDGTSRLPEINADLSNGAVVNPPGMGWEDLNDVQKRDIQKLHGIFPDKSREELTNVYLHRYDRVKWHLEKNANNPGQDEPSKKRSAFAVDNSQDDDTAEKRRRYNAAQNQKAINKIKRQQYINRVISEKSSQSSNDSSTKVRKPRVVDSSSAVSRPSSSGRIRATSVSPSR